MGFAAAGVAPAGALGVLVRLLVGPHLAAFDSPVRNLKHQKTGASAEVRGQRGSIVGWYCNSHLSLPFRWLA
jgi:hypothetical protein